VTLVRCLLVAWAITFASLAYGADCRKVAQVCIDGPSTKTVQGISMYRDCWAYNDTYECVDPDSTNYCYGLELSGCSQTSSTCSSTAFNGWCTTETKTFRCGDPVAPMTGVIELAQTYTVIQDVQDYSACASLQSNASCQKIGQVCTSGAATRNINGVDVWRDCWEWRDDYSCIAADVVDYCTPLKNLGCIQQGAPVCVEWAFNGTCNRHEVSFVCTNKPPQSGPNIVYLDTSYTIVLDNLNATACDVYAKDTNCRFAGQRCVEGPATRNINGLDVFKDCWRYENDYTCQVANPLNYCLPLENTPGCSEVGTPTCAETVENTCYAQERTYRCDDKVGDPLPPNVTFLDTAYTIVSENIRNECVNLETNPNCVLAEAACIDGPSTKNINGLDVFRECWTWQKIYTCSDPNLSTSDCGEFETNAKCKQTEEKCTAVNDITKQCAVKTRTYSCEEKAEKTITSTVCGTELCIAGVCTPSDGPPDDGFADAIVGMEIGRQAGVYGDYKNGTFFNGEFDSCKKKLWGSYSCCKPKVQGGTDNSSMGAVKEFGTAAGKEAIQYMGSTYMHDILFNSGAPDLIINALYGSGGGASYSASFSFYGITYDFAAGTFAFDPVSFAIAVAITLITEYLQCEPEEQVLALKKGQNLCHYVGTFCKVKGGLGDCVEKAEGYCCFNSRLARIIHEGGRPQLGLDWGPPENPKCGGFSQAQLEAIDFSKIDFSEFITEIASRVINGGPASARAEDRAKEAANLGTSYFAMPQPTGVVCAKPPC